MRKKRGNGKQRKRAGEKGKKCNERGEKSRREMEKAFEWCTKKNRKAITYRW